MTGRRHRHLDEIAGPDGRRSRVQEGRPGRSGAPRRTDLIDIFLNAALADVQPQFQQFATDAFRAPEPILGCHLANQADGLSREWRLATRMLRLAPPDPIE